MKRFNTLYESVMGEKIGVTWAGKHPSGGDSLKRLELLELLRKCTAGQVTVNEDGSVDVVGDVDVPKELIKDGIILIKFGKIVGDFKCHDVEKLKPESCPMDVTGHSDCRR